MLGSTAPLSSTGPKTDKGEDTEGEDEEEDWFKPKAAESTATIADSLV